MKVQDLPDSVDNLRRKLESLIGSLASRKLEPNERNLLIDLLRGYARLRAITGHVEHAESCQFVPPILGKAGMVLANGMPCSCGLTEFLSHFDEL